MGREVSIRNEVIFDFLRKKANRSPQLDVGQSLFPQIKDGLKTNMEISAHLFGRPQMVIVCGGIMLLCTFFNRVISESAADFR